MAHPFDDGTAILLHHSIEKTSQQLGADAHRYQKLLTPFVNNWDKLAPALLGPLTFPNHPLVMGRFGLHGLRSAAGLARAHFKHDRARALFAGVAAHSCLSLDHAGSAAFGLVLLSLAHAVNWPIARGGTQQISNALAAHLRKLGGEIVMGVRVQSLNDLAPSSCVLFDLTPRQLLRIAGERFPEASKINLVAYRYGPAAFKLDWALDGPVPWRASECAQAATVHLGGTLAEIEASEAALWEGKCPERPYVLVAQPSLFDSSRAPEGKHTLWAYCHVPNGSAHRHERTIENQIERFAPGFRSRIIARTVTVAGAVRKPQREPRRR